MLALIFCCLTRARNDSGHPPVSACARPVGHGRIACAYAIRAFSSVTVNDAELSVTANHFRRM
jgi:hypothetical protein